MFDPWVRKIPWSKKWQPTPVVLPGKSHGPRSLVGYSPWGPKSQTRLRLNHQPSSTPYPQATAQWFRIVPGLGCLLTRMTVHMSSLCWM